jgi:hypothetical protein
MISNSNSQDQIKKEIDEQFTAEFDVYAAGHDLDVLDGTTREVLRRAAMAMFCRGMLHGIEEMKRME